MRNNRWLCLFSTLFLIQLTSFAQLNNKPHASLNHVAIYVVDLQKSGDFYSHVIGLDTISEPFHDGKHIWLQIAPYTQMHIIKGADKPREYYKNNHFCFSVPSIEAFVEKLRKEGINLEDVNGKKDAISTRVDVVKQLWLQDPDGYWLEINDARN
jgi:lactoylglutathione lyase